MQINEQFPPEVLEGLLAALDESSIGVLLWREGQGRVMWSSQIAKIWGTNRAPDGLEDLLSVIHPDDRSRVEQEIQGHLAAKSASYEVRYRVVHSSGEPRWVSCVARSGYDGDRASYTLGIMRDISLDVLHENEAVDAQALLLEIGTFADIGSWVFNVTDQSLQWSKVTRDIHEVPEDFVPDLHNAIGFYSGESRSVIERAVQQCAAEGTPYDERLIIRTYSGRLRHVRAQGRRVVSPAGTVKLLGGFQDVTNEVAFEDALRFLAHGAPGGAKAFMQETVKNIAELLEADFCFLMELVPETPTLVSLAGYSRESGQIQVSAERYGTPCDVALEHGVAFFRADVCDRFPDATSLVEMQAQGYLGISLNASDGTAMGVLSVSSRTPLMPSPKMRDILTIAASRLSVEVERHHVENRLRQMNLELERRVAERTAALEALNQDMESFTYSVSHDLRAPLRHMAGYAHVMQEYDIVRDEPELINAADSIIRSAKRMGMLIDDLLAFSRSGRLALNKIPIKLNTVVKDCIAEIPKRADGFEITWNVGDLGTVVGDPTLLRIAVQNLIDNAAKYTRRNPAPVVNIETTFKENTVVFSVSDNGVGFDMQYAHQLFGVFNRLHLAKEFEGSGIGLATVDRIIERHGGSVGANGVTDVGATFWFELPAKRLA